MSLAVRIIPRMDIKGSNLVKGMHLEGLRVLGKPEIFAKHYYQQGADELFFQDVVASLYGRNSLHEIIKRTAKEISIPLTVGGGIRSLENIKCILRSGADKVAINTAAIEEPTLISKAAKMFGSSTIVVAIEAIQQADGGYIAYTDNGRNSSGLDVFMWAKKVEELGAGELVLTSVDREGSGKGADLSLLSKVASLLSIPVIAHGGIGKKSDVLDVFNVEKINATAVSSMFHYEYVLANKENESYKEEGNIEFLRNKRQMSLFEPASILDTKKFLIKNNIHCRKVSNS